MNQTSVIDFFTNGCKHGGDQGWLAARFSSPEEQIATYHRLCLLPNLGKSSLLDVGCGQGDLYGMLKEAGYQGEYTGIDITPAMIEMAKNKYPSGNFAVADIFNLPRDFKKDFDYVIAAGCFNVKFSEEQKTLVPKAMKVMYELCTKAVSMTLLSHYGYEVAKGFDCLVCYEPGEIVQQVLSITPSLVMDHQSLPAEFVITMYH